MVSGLELRFLSLCSKLGHVTMLGCPLADLPDYLKIVKNRLPQNCILDNEDDSDDETGNRAMQEKLLNLEDANFIKELVADGLLVRITCRAVSRSKYCLSIRFK